MSSDSEAPSHQKSVDLLILGAGWTANFLIPLLRSRSVSYAATTRSGRGETLKFIFDPESASPGPFQVLPAARTVLITFPIYGTGGSKRLVQFYSQTHLGADPHFIQLGSSGIYGNALVQAQRPDIIWWDRHSPYNTADKRAVAEDELLSLSPSNHVTVLVLCGLWGGERSVRNWVVRVAPTKDALRNKTSIHLIHGLDVARAILAVHDQFHIAGGSRWLLTDGRVYDWWDLASAWGDGGEGNRDKMPTGPQQKWVRELMDEENVRALPRAPESLKRALDSREFWAKFGLSPARARVEGDCLQDGLREENEW